jgi:hypothetical protein
VLQHNAAAHRVDHLDALDVNCALTLLAVLHFERNQVSLHQRIAKACAFHIALMEENILCVFNLDEPKSFCHIEQLHSTLHEELLYAKEKHESPSNAPGLEIVSMNLPVKPL